MKKYLFTIIALLAISTTTASAQRSFRGWTIKAGSNYSTIKHKADINATYNYKFGFTGGVALDWGFTDIMGISVELLYSKQGAKFDVVRDNIKANVVENSHYANIPILANVFLTDGLTFKTGLQGSYFLGADDKIKVAHNNDRQYDLVSEYRVMDVSVPLGLSYNFKFGLVIDARYHFGITDMIKKSNNFPNLKAYNKYASLTIGYRF